MIFDKLDNAGLYDKKLQKGFDFLKNTDLKALADGRYEIDGSDLYANVQTLTTKQKALQKWECHRDYIDIQYVIKGKECMGFGLLDDFKTVVEAYDKEKDLEFLDGEKYNYVNVSEGEFVVFYPTDVHAPMLSVSDDIEIKKVIVKVKI